MRGLLGLILAGQALAIYDPNDPVGHRIYGVHGSPEATDQPGMEASVELGGIDKNQITNPTVFYQHVGEALASSLEVPVGRMSILKVDDSQDNGQTSTLVTFKANFPSCMDTTTDEIIHKMPGALKTAVRMGTLWKGLRDKGIMVTFVEENGGHPFIKGCRPVIQMFMSDTKRIVHAKNLKCKYKGTYIHPTQEDMHLKYDCRHEHNLVTNRDQCTCHDIVDTIVPTPAPTISPTQHIAGKCTLHGGGIVAPGWNGQGSGDHYCNTCTCTATAGEPALICSAEICALPRPDMCTLNNGEEVKDGWSGQDTGINACNTCVCHTGSLGCSEITCSYSIRCPNVVCPAVDAPCPDGQEKEKDQEKWEACCFNPTHDCKMPAPIDCVLSDWLAEGSCDKECGGGTQELRRTPEVDPNVSGKSCEIVYGDGREHRKISEIEPLFQKTQSCNTFACPTPAPTGAPTKAAVKDDWLDEDTEGVPTATPTAKNMFPIEGSPTAAPVAANTGSHVPTASPTIILTDAPTKFPTKAPTTGTPTPAPTTSAPTLAVTDVPTHAPTNTPTTLTPTAEPTKVPTSKPTNTPTLIPTSVPSEFEAYEEFQEEQQHPPTPEPSIAPTKFPTETPSLAPTSNPTTEPTQEPTHEPSAAPSPPPTNAPTPMPTQTPTTEPTSIPTAAPTTGAPTPIPTKHCNCVGDRPCLHDGGQTCFPTVGGACPAQTTLCTCPCAGDAPCAGTSGCFAETLFLDAMICPSTTVHCKPEEEEHTGEAKEHSDHAQCHCGGTKPCQHDGGSSCFEAASNTSPSTCHEGTYSCDCPCQDSLTPCKTADGTCVGLTTLFGVQSCPLTTVQCKIGSARTAM